MALRPSNHHILVIEDDPDTAEFIKDLLTLAGYTVTLETTGAAGLTQTRELKPDLILLDYRLPDGFGVEVCRQLRTEFGPSLPIVILSADGQTVEDQSRAAEASAVVHKPFKPDVLLTLLATYVPL